MIPKSDTFQAYELFRPNLSFIYYQILLYVFQCHNLLKVICKYYTFLIQEQVLFVSHS